MDNNFSVVKIVNLVSNILTDRFNNEGKREIEVNNDKINFACPYCGDSDVSDTKKRGNIYLDTLQYHCFNCGKHTYLYKFLKDFKQRLERSDVVKLKTIVKKTIAKKKIEDNKPINIYNNVKQFKQYAISKKLFMRKNSLVSIKYNDWIKTYLNNRMITEYDKFAWDNFNRQLYIFNMIDDDNFIGYQIRNMDSTKSKYLTFPLKTVYQSMNLSIDKNVESLSKLSTTFNLLSVDMKKPIYIFEGPIDSFMIPNSIALSGSSNNLKAKIPHKRWIFDYDKTGTNKMLDLVKKGEHVFAWKKYLVDHGIYWNKNCKLDYNDLVILAFEKSIKLKPIEKYFINNVRDVLRYR